MIRLIPWRCITARWIASLAVTRPAVTIRGGPAYVVELDRIDLVHHTEERSGGGLDRVPPIDRRVAVEDLLEDLGVRDQPVAGGDGALQEQS